MANYNKILFLLILTFLSYPIRTQILWQKNYGKNDKTEVASRVIETSVHNFIITGSTCDTSLLAYLWGWDGYIICTNSNGDTLWTKVLGSTANDFINDIIEIAPHTFLAAGMGYKASANSQQVWLIKLQLNSTESQVLNIEQKHYGKNGKKDGATKIIKNSDGTFFITGFTEGYGTQQGGSDAWLLKLNAQLDTLWTKTYDLGYEENADCIIPLNDGTFLLLVTSTTGQINNFPIPPYYCTFASVLHINQQGDILKTLTFDNDTINYFKQGIATSDGGVLLIGGTGVKDNSYIAGGRNLFLVKLNSNLDTVWTKIYGNYGTYDSGVDLMEWHDGGYMALGYTQSFYKDSVDNWWLLRLDANGDTVFSRVLIHRKKNDDPCSMILSSYGKIIIAGWVDANSNVLESTSMGNADICTMALDSSFATSIQTSSINIIVYPNPFHEYARIVIPDDIKNATLFIYDLNGKLLFTEKYNGSPLILTRETIHNGIYVLILQTEKGIHYRLIEIQ